MRHHVEYIYKFALKSVRDAGCGALASRIPHPASHYVGRVKVAECGFAESSKIALLGFHNDVMSSHSTDSSHEEENVFSYSEIGSCDLQLYIHTGIKLILYPLASSIIIILY